MAVENSHPKPLKLWEVDNADLVAYVARMYGGDFAPSNLEVDQLLDQCLAKAQHRAVRMRHTVPEVITRIHQQQTPQWAYLNEQLLRTRSREARATLSLLVNAKEYSRAGLFGRLVRADFIQKRHLTASGILQAEMLTRGEEGFPLETQIGRKSEQQRVDYFSQRPEVLRALTDYTVSERNPMRAQLIKEHNEQLQLVALAEKERPVTQLSPAAFSTLYQTQPLSLKERLFQAFAAKRAGLVGNVKILTRVPAAATLFHF